MIDGPTLKLGDREFIVPPANLKAVRAHGRVREKEGVSTQEIIDANLAFILATLQRNYPDLTEDFLLENLDSRNQHGVMNAILESAGYEKVEKLAGESPPSAAP